MKVELASQEREHNLSLVDSMSFNIDDEHIAHIMGILRSQLYTNPIAAVCREYMANARDSHKEAGKHDTPITVILPTALRSEWTCIDEGVGLSPDELKNIWTTYGASTKRDSDEMIGGFGIGSKSAFSYATAFTIVTRKDGMEYKYTAYIDNETNKGRLVALAEPQPTSKSNGVEIKVVVKDRDRDKFIHETVRACYYWDTLPNIVNLPELQRENLATRHENTQIEGTDWQWLKEWDYGWQSSAHAVIGGIPFPIESSKISLDQQTKRIVSCPIVIHAEVGDMDPAVNREALRYSTKTIKFLEDKFKVIMAEVSKKSLEDIQAGDGEFQQWKRYHTLRRTSGMSYYIQGYLKQVLDDKIIEDKYKVLPPNCRMVTKHRIPGQRTAAVLADASGTTFDVGTPITFSSWNMETYRPVFILHNKCKRKSISPVETEMVRAVLSAKTDPSKYFIVLCPQTDDRDQWLKDNADFMRQHEVLKLEDVIDVTQVKKKRAAKKAAPTVKKTKTEIEVYHAVPEWHRDHWTNFYNGSKKKVVDTNEKDIIYVKLNGPHNGHGGITAESLVGLTGKTVREARQLLHYYIKQDQHTFYGVVKKDWNKIPDHWKPFHSLPLDGIADLAVNDALQDQLVQDVIDHPWFQCLTGGSDEETAYIRVSAFLAFRNWRVSEYAVSLKQEYLNMPEIDLVTQTNEYFALAKRDTPQVSGPCANYLKVVEKWRDWAAKTGYKRQVANMCDKVWPELSKKVRKFDAHYPLYCAEHQEHALELYYLQWVTESQKNQTN